MQEKAKDLGSFEKYLVREIFKNNNEKLFMQKNVSELMFQGYFQPSVAEMAELAEAELLPDNTFGFFYKVVNLQIALLKFAAFLVCI